MFDLERILDWYVHRFNSRQAPELRNVVFSRSPIFQALTGLRSQSRGHLFGTSIQATGFSVHFACSYLNWTFSRNTSQSISNSEHLLAPVFVYRFTSLALADLLPSGLLSSPWKYSRTARVNQSIRSSGGCQCIADHHGMINRKGFLYASKPMQAYQRDSLFIVKAALRVRRSCKGSSEL